MTTSLQRTSFGELGLSGSVTRGGGWWGVPARFESFRDKREEDKKKRDKILEEIVEIEDEIDREIAEIIQKDVIKEDREKELKALEVLVKESFEAKEQAKAKAYGVEKSFVRAAIQANFSALEAFEREMDQAREEEEFLMIAMMVLN
jgi:hypothetical protein